MTFSGVENQSVEPIITNYEFPNNSEGDWDGNWLNIYINVKSKMGNWQTVHPLLTTWDVLVLTDWFDTLSKNAQPKYRDVSFTEPNLSFKLLNSFDSEVKTIRIKFDHESRPVSATDGKEYYVDCMPDNNELKRLAIDLKMELSKYPERKPANKSGDRD